MKISQLICQINVTTVGFLFFFAGLIRRLFYQSDISSFENVYSGGSVLPTELSPLLTDGHFHADHHGHLLRPLPARPFSTALRAVRLAVRRPLHHRRHVACGSGIRHGPALRNQRGGRPCRGALPFVLHGAQAPGVPSIRPSGLVSSLLHRVPGQLQLHHGGGRAAQAGHSEDFPRFIQA